jgi:acyl carrier protein
MDAFDEQLLDIFRRKVKKKYRDAVRPEARLQADLGMDSLGVLSAMMIAEEELSIVIFPLQADVGEIRTVGDIIRILKALKQPIAGD